MSISRLMPQIEGSTAHRHSAVRHEGYLNALYHRHVMKWGSYRSPTAKKKAIIVVAHAMLVIVWHVLATGKPYDELGADS
jgi:transposase